MATAKKTEKPTLYYAIGRRKEATARVRFYVLSQSQEVKLGEVTLKQGDIIVNDRPIDQYFSGEVYKKIYLEPFRTTNTLDRFGVSVKIIGGGTTGQLDAFVHGVSRTLEKINREQYRPILKKRGFMKRDPRVKERRKAGLAQSARAKKQSPKR